MKKIAVFVEGQGEQVFVRNLLFQLIEPSKFSFDCIRLRAGNLEQAPYSFANPNAEVYFEIINVEGDRQVLKIIRKREERLFEKGFTKIIGLRDMYSEQYKKNSTSINDEVTQKFIERANKVIATMSQPDRISLHFAIMELEAWWLSMYNLWRKIDSRLTPSFIEDNLGYNLALVNPQTEFFHPEVEVARVLKLANSSYDKQFKEVEGITSKIEPTDIREATENNRCDRFHIFCADLCADLCADISTGLSAD